MCRNHWSDPGSEVWDFLTEGKPLHYMVLMGITGSGRDERKVNILLHRGIPDDHARFQERAFRCTVEVIPVTMEEQEVTAFVKHLQGLITTLCRIVPLFAD